MTTEKPLYLMSPPRPDWALLGRANFLSSQDARPVGPRQALVDWLSIADAIEDAGGHVVVLPPAPQHNLTGLPYVAEAGHTFRTVDGKPGVFIPNMKAPHRVAEGMYLAGFYAGLGFETRSVDGLWEGQGDAIRVDAERVIHTYGKGSQSRTQEKAYPTVAPAISHRHMLLEYRADPWFHGNTFLGVYRSADGKRGTVMLCPEAVSAGDLALVEEFVDPFAVHRITVEESRAYATNALQVGRMVIAPSGLDAGIHAVWEELGLHVIPLELAALFKSGGGAAVCLTNRMDGIRVDEVPRLLAYAQQKNAWRARLADYPVAHLTPQAT